MPAAAPAPLSSAVGSVQNTGSEAKKPKPATHSHAILNPGVPAMAAMTRPITIVASGITVCHLRSPVRSECRLHRIMPTAPTA